MRRGCGNADQSAYGDQSADGHVTCAHGNGSVDAWSTDGDIASHGGGNCDGSA